MPYRIRPFEPDDFDAVFETELRLIARRDYPDLPEQHLQDRWRAYLEKSLGLADGLRDDLDLLILVDGDDAYGGHILLVQREAPVTGEPMLIVGMIVVREELHGQGLGTRLMRHAEQVARDRDIACLRLGVDPDNPARRLYDRLGYRPRKINMSKRLDDPGS